MRQDNLRRNLHGKSGHGKTASAHAVGLTHPRHRNGGGRCERLDHRRDALMEAIRRSEVMQPRDLEHESPRREGKAVARRATGRVAIGS